MFNQHVLEVFRDTFFLTFYQQQVFVDFSNNFLEKISTSAEKEKRKKIQDKELTSYKISRMRKREVLICLTSRKIENHQV